ncbi:MAG: serine/threonine-protein kinase [Acidobacteriota bacterium]
MKALLSRWIKRRTPPVAESGPGADLPLQMQTVTGRYSDLGEIGRGGMSSVRRMLDRSLLREAALKRLDSDLAIKDDQIQRFLLEAQVTGQLDHPNIVPIHELGRDEDGAYYFTMKMVEGMTLADKIEAAGDKRLQPDLLAEFLQILVKVCEALSFAHSRGVIHRDVKPSNIMVGQFGQVYIMDWGVARVLPLSEDTGSDRRVVVSAEAEIDAPGSIIGSPAYMAPEQVEGYHEALDARTDVFALGATLYHLLTGAPPYSESNYYKLLSRVLACEFEPPHEVVGRGILPPGLTRIAMKAMAAQPAERYAAVGDLKRDLELFMRGAWHLPTETFAPGKTIVREGDEADVAYIITEGRCRVLKETQGQVNFVRELASGEVFGEMAIFSSQRRTATVEAIDQVTVMVVERDTLSSGLELNSWMGSFVKAMADRFLEIDSRLRMFESGVHPIVQVDDSGS